MTHVIKGLLLCTLLMLLDYYMFTNMWENYDYSYVMLAWYDYLCCEEKLKWLKVVEKKYYHTRAMDVKIWIWKVMCHKMKCMNGFVLDYGFYICYACMEDVVGTYLRVKLIFKELPWKMTTICCKINY